MSYVSPIKIGYEAEPEEGWTDKIGKYIAGEVDNLVLESCVNVGCHVDKDELEKALRYDRGQYEKGYEDGKHDAAAAIEALQAQLPKRGEWVGIEYDGYADGNPVYDVWECSECGEEHEGEEDTLTNYCPNCGAKMEVQDG